MRKWGHNMLTILLILTMTIVFKPQLRTGEVDKSRNLGRLISKFPRHICAIIKQLSYLFNLLKTFFL